jgi:hypothetical protein
LTVLELHPAARSVPISTATATFASFNVRLPRSRRGINPRVPLTVYYLRA